MFDIEHIIQSGGLIALAAIVFAESGLMVGFFLPGDTLLLSAGVFASQGQLPLVLTIMTVASAAILGDNVGYTFGRAVGPRVYKKKDGIIFRQAYIQKTEQFYKKYGAKTMLLAHFVPFVRSFAPVVAGVAKMPRWKFFVFDAVGDIFWATSVTLIGFWFGSRIPNLDHYIMPVIAIVITISFGPMLWHIFGDKTTRQRLFHAIKRHKLPEDDPTAPPIPTESDKK